MQPDCNIPCGESFARHALIAQNYFMEKFGVTAKTGYNVDSFGHQGMMPQILQLSGMENYVFMRPGPHEKGRPGILSGNQMTVPGYMLFGCRFPTAHSAGWRIT